VRKFRQREMGSLGKKEAFASLRSIFSQLPFKKRGAMENALDIDHELFEQKSKFL
jgi:hypothetical protein